MGSVLMNNFILSLAGVIMMVAAANDVRRLIIPNWTVLSLLIIFPFFVLFTPTAVSWPLHLLVFAIFLVAGYGIYAMKWVGAGDIKFLAACALWAGPHYWGQLLFITTLTGGVLGLTLAVIALLRKQFSKEQDATPIAQAPVPYGVAIAVGGLCSLALLSHPELLSLKV